MTTRTELLGLINSSGLADTMTQAARAVHERLTRDLGRRCDPDSDPDLTLQQKDRHLLNNFGPAAAGAAIEFATGGCGRDGLLKNTGYTENQLQNFRLVQNDEGYPAWSGQLRRYLLPRYAYVDFDSLVDPRHRIDEECGYPRWITPIMYRYLYQRDDIARRVVDIYPDESWAADPEVYDDDDEEVTTPFEERWAELCLKHKALQYLYRLDKLSGVGHYGVLLLGYNDGLPLDQPVRGLAADGTKDPNAEPRLLDLLYLRPFDEYLAFVQVYERDQNSPRYGQPLYYNLVFVDMTVDAGGAAVGTRTNTRVHWTRVLHVADNLLTSLVFGTPRQEPVFNRLLDLRKVKGGSAEMFWKGAFPGYAFEIDPEFVADDPDFDKASFRDELEQYSNGLKRYLSLVGIKAKSLAPQVADPSAHVHIQLQAIAAHYGIPLRIFLGSEEGRLASSQDKLTWNQRLGRRCKNHVEPEIVRAFIDRQILVGAMPSPKAGKYFVGWGDLNAMTDEDKANLALKWTQALSQYVSTGMIHFIPPMDYLTMILGLRPADAKKIISHVEDKGGWAMLLKVDPSQGAGVNGKRQDIAGGSGGRGSEGRQPADQKAEGSSS